MYSYPFSGTLFENILAIDVHTWHQLMQDRFLYLYIKIQKNTILIKCFKKCSKLGAKLSSLVKMF